MNDSATGRAIGVGLMFLLLIVGGVVDSASPAPANRSTIGLDPIAVAFDVPEGFIALQEDNRHHWWHAIIRFGKEYRLGHFEDTSVRLVFWPAAYDGRRTVTEHSPSRFVDVEYRRIMDGVRRGQPGFGWEPEYLKILGNKAVRYTVMGLDAYLVVMGYVRANQLPASLQLGVEEYQVRIDAYEDSASRALVDTIVNSLRIVR